MDIGGIGSRRIAGNTLWILLGFAGRTAVQGVTFLAVARVLGVAGYGAFAGTLALVSILSPFAGLGMGNVLVQEVARAPEVFRVYWGRALAVIGVSGLVLAVPLLLVASLVLPDTVPLALVIVLAITELWLARVVDVGTRAFMAFDRGRETALVPFVLFTLRMVAAGSLFLAFPRVSPLTWGVLYLASTLAAAVVVTILVGARLGWPVMRGGVPRGEIRLGFLFAIGLSAQNVYNDVDKTMLVRMVSTDVAGAYAAAYRLLDMAFTPVGALLHATYATFFRRGTEGVRSTIAFAVRLIPFTVGYSVAVAAVVIFAAPLLTVVLGEGFAASVSVARWLALVPVFRAVHYLLADALTGAGRQAARSGIQIGTALLNVLLNLWLIPRYSWHGAVVGTLVCEAALAGGLAVLVWRAPRQPVTRPA